MLTTNDLLRQAEQLEKFAKVTREPSRKASLLAQAADLRARAGQTPAR